LTYERDLIDNYKVFKSFVNRINYNFYYLKMWFFEYQAYAMIFKQVVFID